MEDGLGRKTQGEKSSLWANKGQKKCWKERANFRGLMMNDLRGKKEKIARNDFKIKGWPSGRKLAIEQ